MSQTLALAAVLAAAGPAWAQDKIIFSKPADADTKTKQDANLVPEARHESHSLFNLPMTMFEDRKPALPPFAGGDFSGAAQTSPGQQRAWQKALEKKDKWTLMTPEEIMGLPTAEKILGLPAKNGEDKLTLEERFTRRMEKRLAGPAPGEIKSALPGALVRSQDGLFAHHRFESVFARPEEKNPQAQAAAAQGFNSFVNSPFATAEKPDSIWGNTFHLPVAARPVPEQLAGMDRFRQMLQPSALLEKTAPAFRAPAAAPRHDSFMDAASPFGQHGGAFAPVRNEAGRPRGVMPLPGITARVVTPPKRSPSQPDLPPWLRPDGEKMKSPLKKF